MTAQVPDTVRLGDDLEGDGEPLAIAGVNGGGLFDPAAHNLEPAMIHTACWRGYVCAYAVKSGRLTLDALHLGSGSKIEDQPIAEGTPLLSGTAHKQAIAQGGGYAYQQLGWPVPFTGGLLLGSGFVRSTYVHMGFHPAWKFERVIELIVDHGFVRETSDRSADVALRRWTIESGGQDPDGSRDDMAWIKRTFTLDYGRTFG